VEAGVDRFWLWLSVGTTLPQRAALRTDPDRGGELWLGSARSAVCWDLAVDAPELGVCARTDVHRLRGQGFGIANPRTAVVWWTAVGAGAFGRWSLSDALALQASLDATVPLARPVLFVQELGQVHRPAAVAASFEIGAVLRLR
jgi:hypothetical protein